MIIGIAGGSGSGKSTFSDKLYEEFKNNATIIHYDNYYKSQDDIGEEERKNTNYDHPDALETELLYEHILKLKNAETVTAPVYDFKRHTRSRDTIELIPREIIIVEGILLFHDEKLRGLFDIKIYVDSDADERILRRIERDVFFRGRSLENIMDQYLKTVKPMHYLYVEPTKQFADIIINGGLNEVAYDIVATRIHKNL